MAEKKQVISVTETKETVFNILKNAAPALFGTKVYADVAHFGEDGDTSKLRITFNEEEGQ